MTVTATEATPRVPSRTWHDPVLGAQLSTGADALDMAERFAARLPARSTPVAFDIETPGLENTFTINCVTAAWRWPDGPVQAVLLDPRRNTLHADAARRLLDAAQTVAFHNAPFDIPPLYHAGLITDETIRRIVDTLLLARYAIPDVMVPKNLTALAIKLLGLADDKGGMERAFKAAGYKTQRAGFEGMDITSPVYRYGAMADTVATLALEPLLRERAVAWSMDHPFSHFGATTRAEAEALIHTQETVHRVMLRRSAVGLAVDRDYLDRYRQQVADQQALAEADLLAHGLEGGTGKGAALIRYLDARGELPQPWPRTPKGALRATKADLEALATVNHLAAAQRQLAVIEKVTGYLTKVDKQAEVTGRCHPQVGVLGASATGRMSYAAPEMQQFPKEARPVITDDGQGLTSIDWSQIEPVTMALMAKDAAFLAPYERGEDLYGPIMRAAGVDRDTAKVVLLSTMYGAGSAKVAATIGHTEESAAQIKRQMFLAMKRCERWMALVEQIAANHGVTITAGGRILPVDAGGVFKAVNYTIQGSAYDVLAHTITEMDRQGVSQHLQLAMHDEVVVDTEVAETVQRIMVTPPPFLEKWAERTPVLRTDRADMGHSWAKV